MGNVSDKAKSTNIFYVHIYNILNSQSNKKVCHELVTFKCERYEYYKSRYTIYQKVKFEKNLSFHGTMITNNFVYPYLIYDHPNQHFIILDEDKNVLYLVYHQLIGKKPSKQIINPDLEIIKKWNFEVVYNFIKDQIKLIE